MTTATESAFWTRIAAVAADLAGRSTDEMTPAAHLVNDLGFDSLDRVEFAMRLEEEFDLAIPDTEAEAVNTLGDALGLIQASARLPNPQ